MISDNVTDRQNERLDAARFLFAFARHDLKRLPDQICKNTAH